jgi:hypothetical protein
MNKLSEQIINLNNFMNRIILPRLFFLCGVAGVVILPFLIPRFVLQWTQINLPLIVHVIILAIFFAILFRWAYLISGDRAAKFYSSRNENGIRWPIMVSLSLLFFSIPCFASLTSTLSDLGYVSFEPRIHPGELAMIQDFYLWHFLESIPGLKIPETLLWNVPFNYKDTLSGWLLLIFKLSVILPVIGSFSVWNGVRKEQKKNEESKATKA